MKDEECIMVLLKEISCDISSKLNKLYEPYGLTCVQFDILVQLSMESDCTISILANHLHMRISNLSAILQRMEKHGFVRRIRDEQDQRNVRIQISPESCKMMEDMMNTRCKKEDVFKNIDSKDILVIRQGLEKLREVLKECDAG